MGHRPLHVSLVVKAGRGLRSSVSDGKLDGAPSDLQLGLALTYCSADSHQET